VIVGAEPLHLAGEGGRAVLVVHGFGDTPQSVGELARALHAEGWTVHVPLLPGHGRSLAAFAASGAAEWRQAVREAHATLAARHAAVALVGQSMGGALAVELAAALGAACPAVVLLAPYLAAPRGVRWGRAVAPCWGGSSRCSRPTAARAPSTTPRRAPRRSGRGSSRRGSPASWCASWTAHGPRCRTSSRPPSSCSRCAITASRRPPPPPRSGGWARPTGAEKRLEWLDGCGHVVAADRERDRVRALAAAWLAEHVGPRPRSTPHGGAASVSPLPA
jgi:carboxylesterase